MSSSLTRTAELSSWVVERLVGMVCGSPRTWTGMEGAGGGTVSRTGIGGAVGIVTPGDFTGTAADATERIEGSTGEATGSAFERETGAAVFQAGFTGEVLF